MRAAERARSLRGNPLVRQFTGLSGGRIVAALVSFVWLAVAARRLPVDEFADLALVLSVGAMVAVITDWGLVVLLNEAVAAEPARARSSLVLVVRRRLLLSVPAIGILAVAYLVAANDRSGWVPTVYAVSLLATVAHTSAAAALRGMGRIAPEAVNEVVSRVVVLSAGALVVVGGGGLVAVVAVYAAADLGSAVYLGWSARRSLSAERTADAARFRIRRAGPLGLASMIGLVYYRIDVWLLALLATATAVAQYSVSYRLLDGLIIPAGAMAMVLIGNTANLAHGDAVRRSDQMAGLLSLILLPAVALLVAAPSTVLRVAFGPEYVDGASILRILALAVIPSAAALAWAPLVALRSRGLLVVTTASLVLNLGLNLALIPAIGARGAAIATVVGQCLQAVAFRVLLRRSPASAADPTPLATAEV